MGFACIQVARSSPQRPSGSFHGSSSSFVIPICNIDSIQILTVSLLNEKKLNIGKASIVRSLGTTLREGMLSTQVFFQTAFYLVRLVSL